MKQKILFLSFLLGASSLLFSQRHDLSLVNLKYMHTHIPWLDEVSIGHALISDALYMGLKQTIEEYKNCLRS